MRQAKLEEAEALAREGVVSLREGNALWPGLIFFAGITFVVYLSVEAASGGATLGRGLAAQIGLAGALAGYGGWLLMRARYFHVAVETSAGSRRIGGLTKAEQQEIARRLRPGG